MTASFRTVIARKAAAGAAPAKAKKPRKVAVYVDLGIEEVSGVDVPAQGGARVVAKRRVTIARAHAATASKAACMTMADKSLDHSHLINGHDDSTYGTTSSADSSMGWHSHPWVRKGGKLTIGMARGHTHDLDPEDALDGGVDDDQEDASGKRVRKTKTPITTPDDDGDKPMAMSEDEKRELETAKSDAARWRKLAIEFTGEERDYAKRLDPEARAVFLQKDAAGRKAELDADAVVYESPIDKRIFRKSHNPELVESVKMRDEQKVENEKQARELRKARFAKRAAEELQHLPGTAEEKAPIFEFAESLPKEEGEKFLAAMKAASETARAAFVEKGSREGGDNEKTAEGRYNVALKRFADEKKIAVADADEPFCATNEGRQLKEAITEEKFRR